MIDLLNIMGIQRVRHIQQVLGLLTVFNVGDLAAAETYTVRQMQDFAQKIGVFDAAEFGSGILGTKNSTHVFIADKRKVPDFARLNWELMKILSEKFSCLAVNRRDRGDLSSYTCRTGAVVDIKRSQSQQFVYFVAKQRERGKAVNGL